MFVKNFDTFKDHVGADIMDASPQMALARSRALLRGEHVAFIG